MQKEREKQGGKENADSRQCSVILIDNDKSSGKEFSLLTVESDGTVSSVLVSSKVTVLSSTSTTSSCKKARASSK